MHLHQCLRRPDGTPAFANAAGGHLNRVGEGYVQGLMRRACEFALLSNPTVNAYHRFAAEHSFSPSRASWARENRGALVRVTDGGSPEAAHVENRIGEPSANPYLYVAAQVSSGMEGVTDDLALIPAARRPQVEGAPLPQCLGEAIEAFDASKAGRCLLGDALHMALLALKRSEWSRFIDAEGEFRPGRVSDWEGREYGAEF